MFGLNLFKKDTTEQVTDLLSYGTYLQTIQNFKGSGTKHGGEFNMLDTPSHLYFKILFQFWNGDMDNPGDKIRSGGLLSPTWMMIGDNTDYYNYNSAWAYLKMNGENERAEKLKKMVELLSNVNTYSPWYFQSVEGLTAARTRTGVNGTELKFDERNKISIKCLADSYDDRIGTILDLYRDVVYSWLNKREMIPANLRKFDMSIYIFSSPIFNIHDYKKNYARVGGGAGYITSYKYIEFHNCEIDYNSSASGYDALNNIEGNSPEYTIDIYYDDCYETRYNEFMMRTMGDMIMYDIATNTVNSDGSNNELSVKSEEQKDNSSTLNEMLDRVFYYDTGLLEGLFKEGIGFVKDKATEFITSKVLGNLYDFSFASAMYNVSNLMKGKGFATVAAAKDFLNKQGSGGSSLANRFKNGENGLGNIYKKNSMRNNI